MSPQRRQAVLVGVMTVMLAGAALWSLSAMAEQRERARRAAEDLAACRQLAAEIQALRGQPRVAATEESSIQQLGARIESAARRAGLPAEALQGVFPEAARRVADTPYRRKPTGLMLRGVTLPQAAAFFYHLADGSELRVQELHLRTPPGDGSSALWGADATVTYLIYASPQETR